MTVNPTIERLRIDIPMINHCNHAGLIKLTFSGYLGDIPVPLVELNEVVFSAASSNVESTL